jgi:hypothetical protein
MLLADLTLRRTVRRTCLRWELSAVRSEKKLAIAAEMVGEEQEGEETLKY